jgi:hypothetical protein
VLPLGRGGAGPRSRHGDRKRAANEAAPSSTRIGSRMAVRHLDALGPGSDTSN